MTAVTTDGARTGVEHRDHSGCRFPFALVTATAFRPVTTGPRPSATDAARPTSAEEPRE